MQIDIDIDPRDLSKYELLECLKYAAEMGITLKAEDYPDIIDCSKDYFKELLHEMYEYFAKQSSPAPQPVRDFFWHVRGRLV